MCKVYISKLYQTAIQHRLIAKVKKLTVLLIKKRVKILDSNFTEMLRLVHGSLI